MNELGEKVRILREEKGLSRPVFCGDESELSVRQLVRIEKGEFRPTIKTLEYIANRLDIPSYVLMPDYKELPKRYQELKYFLLHHPDYGDKELQEQKEEYFDEIFEYFYDDLPRDEKVLVDCLQAIDAVRATSNSLYGSSSYGRNSVGDNVSAINLLNIKKVGKRRNNMQWFKVPSKIYFERNSIQYLQTCEDIERVMIVTDKSIEKLGFVQRVIDQLNARSNRVTIQVFSDVEPDPDITTVERGTEVMRAFEPDTIIALGGGSPMDAAKVMWLDRKSVV